MPLSNDDYVAIGNSIFTSMTSSSIGPGEVYTVAKGIGEAVNGQYGSLFATAGGLGAGAAVATLVEGILEGAAVGGPPGAVIGGLLGLAFATSVTSRDWFSKKIGDRPRFL